MKLRNLHKGNGNWGVKCNKQKMKLKMKDRRENIHVLNVTDPEGRDLPCD